MIGRVVPPAWSPIDVRGLLSAAGAALRNSGGAHDQLRASLASRLPAQEVVFTDSGTTALGMALHIAAQLAPGAPVAMPAYGCYDLATAAVGAEAAIRLYDVDPATLDIDFPSLEAALAAGARAVVAVHLFGYPVDMARVHELAKRYFALVIEDAAQALGAEFGGRPAGGWGHLAVLSFGRGKGVTGGRGGALLLNERKLSTRLAELAAALPSPKRGLRDFGLLGSLWVFGGPTFYRIPAGLPFLRLGESLYREPSAPGALSSAGAAAAVRSLQLLERELHSRRRRADWLLERLTDHERLVPVRARADVTTLGLLRLPVLVSDRVDVDTVVNRGRALGLARAYPIALPDLPVLVGRHDPETGLPGARQLASRLITLPTHGRMRPKDLDALADWCSLV